MTSAPDLQAARPAATDWTQPRGGVTARARARMESLSIAERRVARFLLDEPRTAIRLSAKALGDAIGLSDATVVRTAKSLGFDGLNELKFALAAELTEPLNAIHEDVLPDDDVLTITRKVIQADIQAMNETLAILDQGALERVVSAIASADQIVLLGVGSSAPIAIDAQYRLRRIGLPAHFALDGYNQAIAATQLNARGVAIAFSHSGRTHETLDSLARAKSAGAFTVAMTSFADTPITRIADISIVTVARETTLRTEAVSSRIVQMVLVDALCGAVAMRDIESAMLAVNEVAELTEERRRGPRRTSAALRPGVEEIS